MAKEISKITKAKIEKREEQIDSKAPKKRLTIDVPLALHKKLKIASVNRDETMGEIICRLLEENLK